MTRSKRPGPIDLALCEQVAHSCPAMALGSAARTVERVFEQAFDGLEIGGRQFSLLVAMALMGPCTIAQLAHARGLSPTTLSRNLSRLEHKGVVEMASGEDRRERVVSLTKHGQKELMRALAAWRGAMEKIEKAVGAQQLESLHKSLRMLTDRLG